MRTPVQLDVALLVIGAGLLASLRAAAPYQAPAFADALPFAGKVVLVAVIAYTYIAQRLWALVALAVFPAAYAFWPVVILGFLLVAVLGGPVALVVALGRPAARSWWRVGLCVLLVLTSAGSLRLAHALQTQGLRRATERGALVADAIDRYRAREGRLPERLDDLVPRDLDRVPETGMAGFPSFEYVAPADRSSEAGRLFATYELRVNAFRLLQFDCLVYWPEGGYPDRMYGGVAERIGAWVFVRE